MTRNELRDFIRTSFISSMESVVDRIVDEIEEQKDLSLVDLSDEMERKDLAECINDEFREATDEVIGDYFEVTPKDLEEYIKNH